MSRSPVVSCVMSVFNSERYVALAVESILAQTWTDFEFIVIDDGSTDRSSTILQDFARHDPRIVLLSQPNAGLTRALNVGLRAARGEFIARMDADDRAVPQRFAKQVEFLQSQPACVAVGSRLLLIDPDGDPLAEPPLPVTHEAIVARLLQAELGLPHPSVMFRRAEVLQVGGYDEGFTAAQDLDLWLRLGETGRLANLDEPLLEYRLHTNTVTAHRRAEQLACAERAVRVAYSRRGEPIPKDFRIASLAPRTVDKELRSWSRMALRAGHYQTARKHAWAVLKHQPLAPGHWLLLLRSYLG